MSPLNPLNPATGDVPMPEDQREIEAALRAGPITYRLFPYFEWRYGERGRKFTQSDSAWLAWIVRHQQQYVDEQILWLRSVLSNRGMPGWILEIHLALLYKQLVRAIPEKAAAYEKLQHASSVLRNQRREIITDETWNDLASDFVSALGTKPTWLLRGVGRLLVASVADERLGIKNAVGRLECWLSDVANLGKIDEMRDTLSIKHRQLLDSQEFGERWQKAIQATITKAREV